MILTLDVGSSSVRTLLYDEHARQVQGCSSQLPYEVTTTADGGVEVDAEQLAALVIRSLTEIHGQIVAAGRRPAAFACCTFWHSVLGVDASGLPTTPVIHVFDTRSAAAAKKLAKRIDATA